MTNYKLEPCTSQKSFYGKAQVLADKNGNESLRSYDTIVVVRTVDGMLHRTWDGWSATTGKHLRAFCGITKADWDKLPVENWDV